MKEIVGWQGIKEFIETVLMIIFLILLSIGITLAIPFIIVKAEFDKRFKK